MKERIIQNRTLYDLILGIILFNIICQLGLIIGCHFLWGRALYYSIGLWCGCVIAIFMAWHMNRSISAALDYDSETATKLMRKGTYIRYLAIIIILGGFMIMDVVSPLTVFLGIMGLKAGAYAYPLVRSFLNPLVGKEPESECPPLPDDVLIEASDDAHGEKGN